MLTKSRKADPPNQGSAFMYNAKVVICRAERNRYPRKRISTDEQHFAILGQGPQFVVNYHFQFVHVGADFLFRGQYDGSF